MPFDPVFHRCLIRFFVLYQFLIFQSKILALAVDNPYTQPQLVHLACELARKFFPAKLSLI